ncbi:MAG: hypothetical protein ABIH38_05400 [Patescibacteria group bacterium]
MTIRSTIAHVIHPPEIRKKSLLYRGWKVMRQNRCWYTYVPDESHICLWFWPAVFATFVFCPILYPALLAMKYFAKAIRFLFEYGIIWPVEKIAWPFRKYLFPGFSRMCTCRVNRFLTFGGLLILIVGLSPLCIPAIRYWYVGVGSVFILSLLGAWLAVSTLGAFFRSIGQLMKKLAEIGGQGRILASRNYVFALIIVAIVVLYVSPIVIFDGWLKHLVVAIIPFIVGVIVVFIGVFIGVSAGKDAVEDWHDRREEKREETRTGLGQWPSQRAVNKVKESNPALLWIKAFLNDICPVVKFVD